MTHWLDKAADLLSADTNDLKELAVLAGGDPRTFYIFTNMDGADLRGQDLRGMQFRNLDLKTVLVDKHTKFDDPNTYSVYVTYRLSKFGNELLHVKNERYYEDRFSKMVHLIYRNYDIVDHINFELNDKSMFVTRLIQEFIEALRRSSLKDQYVYMNVLKFIDHAVQNTFTLKRRQMVHSLHDAFKNDKEIARAIAGSYSRFFTHR